MTNKLEEKIEEVIKSINEKNLEKKAATLHKHYKDKFEDFITKLKTEGKGTQEAFKLLIQAVAEDKKLTPEEKAEIGEQLKDTLKTCGLVAIVVLPGGTIFLILAHFLKITKYITPSAFLNETPKTDEVQSIPG